MMKGKILGSYFKVFMFPVEIPLMLATQIAYKIMLSIKVLLFIL